MRRKHQELLVWQQAIELVKLVYVVIAKELGYLADSKEVQVLTDRVFALIGGLINSERRTSAA